MRGHMATLLRDARERTARKHEKRERIIAFLRTNVFSTASVLGDVAEVRSRQAIHSTLRALNKEGLIRSAEVASDQGRRVLVWGITPHGAAMAARPGESIQTPTFEPSKVNVTTLDHTLDVQRIQLCATRAGWSWKQGFGEFARSSAKYADAVTTRSDGVKIAIEVERTVKTVKRYAEILVAHLEARKEGKWDLIYYISPDLVIRDRVQRAFREVHTAKWHGNKIAITDAHRAPFRFYVYGDSWNLETGS